MAATRGKSGMGQVGGRGRGDIRFERADISSSLSW